MGDVKVALQEIKEDSESGTPAAVAAAPRKRRGLLMAAVGGLSLCLPRSPAGDGGQVTARMRLRRASCR